MIVHSCVHIHKHQIHAGNGMALMWILVKLVAGKKNLSNLCKRAINVSKKNIFNIDPIRLQDYLGYNKSL